VLKLFSKKGQSSGLVGLSVSDERVLIAQIASCNPHGGAHPYLEKCSRQQLQSGAQAREVLTALVDSLGLHDAKCNYVLSPRDYNLYLIEAPAVEESELSSAVRWKIKDLLDMPAEDAVIDIFPVPEDAFQGRAKMLYAVAAPRARIESLIDLVSRAHLKLQSIDVPELAIRNLTEQFLDDSHGIAFIDLRKTGSTMNLSRNGQLYLTRKINTQLDVNVMTSMDWEVQRDRLVLEIQRSLDYYESQMGQEPISQIVMAPRASDSQELAASLGEVMSVPVSVMDISGQIDLGEGVTATDLRSCTVAIGAALRNSKAVLG
jgi:MSHA biogenesis protein MshI